MADGIGMLPYGKRLEIMNLTTLGERRLRGDLIETFKIINNIVDYGKDIFKLSRSGSNIVSKIDTAKVSSNDICKLRSSFLPERVKNYWNNLPLHVKKSKSINDFKVKLENYKNKYMHDSINNYWEISNMIIDRIEGNAHYLSNKSKFNYYLVDNPYVARKKGINMIN